MPLFEYLSRRINNPDWNIVRVNIELASDYILMANREATLKMQSTMQAGQDGTERDNITKFESQYRGSIAEIYCQELLREWFNESSLNDWEVIRYDGVRTDGFVRAENSYDIKIQKNTNESLNSHLESRSSITYTRNLDEGLAQLDIIGPYTNALKTQEDYVDFYIRPLYDNLETIGQGERFSNHLAAGRIILYFVGGCNEASMRQGIQKTLNQRATRFRCVPIINGRDIIQFRDDIIHYFQELDAN